MVSVRDAAALAAPESGLAVVATLRADESIQSSLINAGVLNHPATSEPVVAFVTYGKVKLANLRARPQIAVSSGEPRCWCTRSACTATADHLK